MSTVEAVPTDIGAAGLAARHLAEQVGTVNLVGAVDSVSAWMPGGTAAAAADTLADAWKQRVAALDSDLDTHGTTLQLSAAAFGTQDANNTHALPRAAQ